MKRKLGEVLIERGVVTEEQLSNALAMRKSRKKRLGKILKDLGYVTDDQIAQVLAEQYSLPVVRPEKCKIEKEAIDLVPADFAREKKVLPMQVVGNKIFVAVADPLDFATIDSLTFVTGKKATLGLAAEGALDEAIAQHYGYIKEMGSFIDGLPSYDGVEFVSDDEDEGRPQVNAEELIQFSSTPPIIKMVTMVIVDAVRERASDVHLEPRESYVQVRYRIDGHLKDVLRYPKTMQEAVVSRVKVISSLDITNHRVPLDGRATVRFEGHNIDLRISVLPALYGEKIVIRLLDSRNWFKPLAESGMSNDTLRGLMQVLNRSQGIILSTGPTGSGKTTTLYGALQQVKSERNNIVTIEDPVEYQLQGITQVEVNDKVGRSFPVALRSIFRQDPDVIFIGEIRDRETADIAVKAALSGHLVLSTIHTNDTVSTLSRFASMGLEPYLVGSAITGIIAQRLVRRICSSCKTESSDPITDPAFVQRCGADRKTFIGKGCPKCGFSGYYGRVGIFEFLQIGSSIRQAIVQREPENKIWDIAKVQGTKSLFDDGCEKVMEGLTTFEEILANIPLMD